MPDIIGSSIGFGYLGVQVCESCYKPNHVFIESGRRNQYCVRCHTEYTSSRDNLPVRIPSSTTHTILAEEIPLCQACENPELTTETQWRFTEAKLGDGTLITVHESCSRKMCDVCDSRFAYVGNRNWRATHTIASNLFANTTNIEGQAHCDSCEAKFWEENDDSDYFCCECCEAHTHYDNSGWYDGTRYCENCIENNVYDCRDCGVTCWDGNDHYCEDDDNDESLIHNYSYRPSPFFFGEGKYYFGFELEVESRGNGRYDGAQIAQNSLGAHAYLKDDGSLSDGFEIVTHPHTLEKYHTDFNWDVLQKLQSQGYRSWNTRTCGLHVHVSRTAFGDGRDAWSYGIPSSIRSQIILKKQSHELRFMKLIYDNQRQVERISGRSNNQYATFQDKGNLVQKVKNGYQLAGRYSAINTENDATIEVRVFKGSLRKERVLSALEFVHAAVEYTRDIKVSTKNHALSWLKFTGYVSANAELYPNLVTIMSESFASDDNPNEVDN